MSAISIRPYLQADHESICNIFNQIVESGDAFVFDTPFSAETLQRFLDLFSVTMVAVQDERIVGGYAIRPNQPGRGSHVANAAYFVDENARGQGIGRLLGEHSLEQAKRMGFSAMQFNHVVASNLPAVRLWQKLGFTIVGTLPQAFRQTDGSLVEIYVMHRFL